MIPKTRSILKLAPTDDDVGGRTDNYRSVVIDTTYRIRQVEINDDEDDECEGDKGNNRVEYHKSLSVLTKIKQMIVQFFKTFLCCCCFVGK